MHLEPLYHNFPFECSLTENEELCRPALVALASLPRASVPPLASLLNVKTRPLHMLFLNLVAALLRLWAGRWRITPSTVPVDNNFTMSFMVGFFLYYSPSLD